MKSPLSGKLTEVAAVVTMRNARALSQLRQRRKKEAPAGKPPEASGCSSCALASSVHRGGQQHPVRLVQRKRRSSGLVSPKGGQSSIHPKGSQSAALTLR